MLLPYYLYDLYLACTSCFSFLLFKSSCCFICSSSVFSFFSSRHFYNRSGIKTADDQRDYADATNNDFAYKNADHDAFFAFVHSRLQGGYFGDVLDSLEDMRGMDLDSFEAMFNYEEQTQDMSKTEREAFLSERRNKVIDTHIERANKIKEIHESLDNGSGSGSGNAPGITITSSQDSVIKTGYDKADDKISSKM